MKQLILNAFLLLSVVSCNIYAPFQSDLGTEGILEEALKCFREGDTTCAINQYNQLPDGALKSRQLCTAYMFRAGMGLSQLISTTKTGGSGMFEALGNEMFPWTASKQSDAEAAFTNCSAYKTSQVGTSNEKESVLLKALSVFLDCALRMAKSDTVNQNDGGAGTCDHTASLGGISGNGIINKDDIAPGLTGDLGASQGMCDTDATTCAGNLANISTELNAAGLSSFNNIPAGLEAAAGDADGARAAIRAAVTTP